MKTSLYSLFLSVLLFSCSKYDYPAPEAKLDNDLSKTTWVITRYDHAIAAQSTFVSDTINFISKKKYTINSSDLKRTYYLSGQNSKSLTMYSLTTLGGDFKTTLDRLIIKDGEINSAVFNDLHMDDSQESGYTLVWMHRID